MRRVCAKLFTVFTVSVPPEVIETYKQDYPGGRHSDSIVSSTVDDGDFARYVIDYAVGNWTALGIEWAGSGREAVFEEWRCCRGERGES